MKLGPRALARKRLCELLLAQLSASVAALIDELQAASTDDPDGDLEAAEDAAAALVEVKRCLRDVGDFILEDRRC